MRVISTENPVELVYGFVVLFPIPIATVLPVATPVQPEASTHSTTISAPLGQLAAKAEKSNQSWVPPRVPRAVKTRGEPGAKAAVKVFPLKMLKVYVPPAKVSAVDVSAVKETGAVMVEKSSSTKVYDAEGAERRAIAKVRLAVRPSDVVPVTTML